VAGLVTPDRFRVARNGSVVERRPGCKDLMYGGEQDLEWAFVDADPFLLQRRPITVTRGES
jgi:hypothetical protein